MNLSQEGTTENQTNRVLEGHASTSDISIPRLVGSSSETKRLFHSLTLAAAAYVPNGLFVMKLFLDFNNHLVMAMWSFGGRSVLLTIAARVGGGTRTFKCAELSHTGLYPATELESATAVEHIVSGLAP